jgi:CTP:molybdopterin cytidylyltransferase MocA
LIIPGYDGDMGDQTINAAVILAAGLSSRMKDFKPLLPLEGEKTIIECSIDSMVSAGIDHIVLVLGHRADDILRVLRRRDYPFLKTALNPRYADSDMMESARVGLAVAQSWAGLEAVFVLPGDMPKIRGSAYDALIRCRRLNSAKVIVPVYGGERAHPPLIHADCLDSLIGYQGEGGLKAALDAFSGGTVCLPVEDRGCVLDADTPEDYKRLLDYQKAEEPQRHD